MNATRLIRTSLNLTNRPYDDMNAAVLVCALPGKFAQQSGTQKFTGLPCGYRGGIGRPNLHAWT